MAMRKGFGHRPRASSKLLTRAQANRTFKHAVRERVIAMNVKCQTVCTLPEGQPCPNGGKHILVSNAELFAPTATGFADGLRITRIEGSLWMRPDYSALPLSAGSCEEAMALLDVPTIFRMGLLKSRVQQALGGVPVAVNPLSDGPSPFALSDAADTRFLKTWNHLWTPNRVIECGQTTFPFGGWRSGGYVVPPIIAGESIGYVVPPDDCLACEAQGSGTVSTQTISIPGWKAFNMAYRRPIVLKENDTLDLWFAWEMMRPCADDVPRGVQGNMMTVGHVFLTIEH